VGQRMYHELLGTPTIQWESEPAARKNICTSRSFGHLLTDFETIREAICNHAASCAQKLRKQQTVCGQVQVFMQTNLHKLDDPQYSRSISIDLELASNDSGVIIRAASRGAAMIFKAGYRYMKCGVIVSGIRSETALQQALFTDFNHSRSKQAMVALDSINRSLGKEIVRFAVQGYEKKYRLKSEFLSKKYTTRLDEIVKVGN
jgi:DNA polymerase V